MLPEIGGYLELERFSGPLLHEGALALNSGRACLVWLLRQRSIQKLALPAFLCDCVSEVCRANGVRLRRYPVGPDLLPAEPLTCGEEEWLYLVNYYGQLTPEYLRALSQRFPRLILDNAQAYFAPPLPGADTLYTCRKFFGVADGAFLYTDAPGAPPERDESFARMGFVLGRFERPAGEFYREASGNNDRLSFSCPRRMSALTENLLRAVDYEAVKRRRTENFALLHEFLGGLNGLKLRVPEGPYAYPFRTENAPALREALIAQKIFVPVLWPNVLRELPETAAEAALAAQILPLPCDQRYGPEEMAHIARTLLAAMGR